MNTTNVAYLCRCCMLDEEASYRCRMDEMYKALSECSLFDETDLFNIRTHNFYNYTTMCRYIAYYLNTNFSVNSITDLKKIIATNYSNENITLDDDDLKAIYDDVLKM